jgi:two-component system sensor histidine kinase/response regulator
LAQIMGGDVGVDSEPGVGSEFWFLARLGIGEAENVSTDPDIELRGRNVLVVDDNEAAALVLCEMLAELGFAVQHANSGAAALECVRKADASETPYEIVLMDWLMPGMDGLETVRALREMNPNTAPVVLMVTAHRRQELVKGAEQLGIAHVLAKPVSSPLLISTLMQLMGAPSANASAAPRRSNSSLERQLGALSGARVLLVEDNEINQQVACELLQEAGFEVDVADNGQIGVNQVQARFTQGTPYDIVLMDMQMPVMDGITATKLIRHNFNANDLPVVAMTANAMKADRDRCIDAGMNDFIAKPIDPEQLWKALLQYIRPRAGLGQNAPARTIAFEGSNQGGRRAIEPTASENAEALADQTLAMLQGLAALDIPLGLQRVMGKKGLYVTLLGKFVRGQHDAIEQISHALSQSDWDVAERIAHTLKGVAGNIGAPALQTQAGTLADAIKNKEAIDLVRSHVQHTEALLLDLLPVLQKALDEGQAGSGTATDSSTEVPPPNHGVLQQLAQLLADDDGAVADLLESKSKDFRILLGTAYPAIEAAIDAFDFEEASRLLSASMAKPA